MYDSEAMSGFLVKVLQLKAIKVGQNRLLVKGVGRFTASRVYQEKEIWLAEGQMFND